jgi:hypothetical protein
MGTKIGPMKSVFTLAEARAIYKEYFKKDMPDNMAYREALRMVKDNMNDLVAWENLIHNVCDKLEEPKERKLLTAYVGGGVVCPSCGNHNALLDYGDYDGKYFVRDENGPPVWYFECRDCHYRIRKSETTVRIMDGEGTPPNRVYKEVERRDGERY